jgi:hypothetical protein
MARLGSCALLAITVFVFSPTTAVARVSPGDLAATRAYFKAKAIEGRAAASAYPAGIAALQALKGKVDAECPGVLVNAPNPAANTRPTQTEEEIADEVGSAVPLTFEHTERRAVARFAHVVKHLRWSNHELTRIARSFAAEQAAQAAVKPPNLCADLKAWVASSYQTVTVGTKRFVHRMNVISGITQIHSSRGEPTLSVETTIDRMLAPYEDPAEKAIIHRMNQIPAQALHLLKQLFDKMEEVLLALKSAPAGPPAPPAQ